jgi:hypothetical protein
MNLHDAAPSMVRLVRASLLVAGAILMVGCAGSGGSAPPPETSSVPRTSADPEPTATDTGGAVLGDVPIACYGLGEQDCHRVAARVASLLTGGDPQVRYVQVGPFGCEGGQRCPTTLAARPEGDVTIETDGGAIGFHARITGDILQVDRQEVFGVSLPPTTRPPLPAAAQPFELGHCGLWSGIDLGGSWWDPVGFVDSDHGDSINAAAGTIVLVGPDRAMFTSKGGLTVLLVRHAGEKYLPPCQ